MAAPTFSVVIDSYNYARFIPQAINSVLEQDVPASEVEIIVVDDGSTDDTIEVVRRFGDKVRLIVQENAGQAAAFATGFAAARGQIICLLDSDDYWAAGKLSAVTEAMKSPAIGLAQNFQRDVNIEGRPLPNSLPDWPPIYRISDLLEGRFINAATSSIAIRRSILDKILPVPSEFFYLHDDYLLMHGLIHGDVANIPRILGYHRMHGTNNSAVLGHPARLERFIREKKLFRPILEAKLRERGLTLSPRYLAIFGMDILRREIMLAGLQGARKDALKKWLELVRLYAGTGLGLFRAATLLLALVSPQLYLRVYELYNTTSWMARLRHRTLPDPPSQL
ncbi:MAG: glycosyltransferase [Elusimicrobiota bacterium]